MFNKSNFCNYVFIIALCATNSAVAKTLTANMRGEENLNWLLNEAGAKVAGLGGTITADVSFKVTPGTLQFAGYKKSMLCVEYGPSPNGEPEFAPCVKEVAQFEPQFILKNSVVENRTRVGNGYRETIKTTDFLLIGASCFKNYNSLILTQEQAPTAPPAEVVINNSNCSAIENFQTEINGNIFSNNQVKSSAIHQYAIELRYGAGPLVIKNGAVDKMSNQNFTNNLEIEKSSLFSFYSNQIMVNASVSINGEDVTVFNGWGSLYINLEFL